MHDPGKCRAFMKDSIRQRLDRMTDRFEEVGRLLADPDTVGRSPQFRDLAKEYARLQPLADRYRDYRRLEQDLAAAEDLCADADPSMRALGEEEAGRLRRALETAAEELKRMLIPRDPRDDRSVFLEV